MIKKLLIFSNIIKIITLSWLILVEVDLMRSGLEYRFHYLIILFIVLPSLFILGFIEYVGFFRLKLENNIIAFFPFLVVPIILVSILFGGNKDPIVVSGTVIFSLTIGIGLFLKSTIKIIKTKVKA